MNDPRFVVCDLGHFHAALVRKEITPEIDPLVHEGVA